MTLLPLVDRELRVAARRSGTYRSRWLVAFGALACFSAGVHVDDWKRNFVIWRRENCL